MKKLLYEVIGNLYEIAFPKKLIKDRRSLLLVVLESCQYMMQNETVDHADNIMVLAVNDMNRLFFCKEKKMYSIVFPFHTECNLYRRNSRSHRKMLSHTLSKSCDNASERAVRPFTNLRKNFGGFSSEQGARVTATFLTFVETCKLMAMAPLDFFRGFFDMIVAGRRDYALMTEVLLVKPI